MTNVNKKMVFLMKGSLKERMKEKSINIINVSTIIMYTFVYIIDHFFAVIE